MVRKFAGVLWVVGGIFVAVPATARAQSETSAGSRHEGAGAPRANEIGAMRRAYRRRMSAQRQAPTGAAATVLPMVGHPVGL